MTPRAKKKKADDDVVQAADGGWVGDSALAAIRERHALDTKIDVGALKDAALTRASETPWRNWMPLPNGQTTLLRSTLRGTVYTSGANQAGKSDTLQQKTVLILVDEHYKFACPPTCEQSKEHAVDRGSCGKHLCPSPENGSADYTAKGCSWPREAPCRIHPPLRYKSPRSIIYGGPNLEFLWQSAYLDGLAKKLPRTIGGKPRWKEDKHTHRIMMEDGSVISFMPYDEITRWVGKRAVFVACDETPKHQLIYEIQARLISMRAQLAIAATAIGLLEGKDQWIINLVNQRHNPDARVQLVELSVLDNPYTDRERIVEVSRSWPEAQRMVRVFGKLYLRNDASIFDAPTIEKQRQWLMPGQRWHVIGITGQELPMDYYQGATSYPQGCHLQVEEKQSLETSRTMSGHRGVACYDCVRRCAAYAPPPRLGPERTGKPTLTSAQPAPGQKAYDVTIFTPPVPGHLYAMGGDVAQGKKNGDFSVWSVWDYETGEQVAVFRDHVGTPAMAAIGAAIHFAYNKAYVVPEANGPGADVIHRMLHEFGVDPIYMYHRMDRVKRNRWTGVVTPEPGFITSRGTKDTTATIELPESGRIPSPLALFRDGLSSGTLVMRCEVTHRECQTFIRSESGLGAMQGCTDDTVIGGMLGGGLGLACIARRGVERPEDGWSERRKRMDPDRDWSDDLAASGDAVNRHGGEEYGGEEDAVDDTSADDAPTDWMEGRV